MAKLKQKKLEGFTDKDLDEIERAKDHYIGIRDERMSLNQQEKAANKALLDLMKKHRRKVLPINGVIIQVVTGEEKVSVRAQKEKKAGD